MQKKYWKPLIITSALTGAIAIATTAAIVVNQRPAAILPIYDYYFSQPVLKQLNDHQYQLKISGKNLNQFVDKKIDQITLVDFNKQTMINDQVASWTNFSLDEQDLVTTITLKQPIAADLYLAIDFQVAPSNAFAFNQNQIPYQKVTLGTWYFYQNPDLIKVVTIAPPTTNDYQIFHFAIQGQNLDQLVDQIDRLVEIKLVVGNEVDHQPFHVKLIPVVKNLQINYQLELQLDHPIKTQLQAQLNWFQFQSLIINPTTNFNGFQTSFERQPILIAQSALVNIDFKQSTIKQINNQIEVGQINNYYFYQVDLVATNLDLIKAQIDQSNLNVFPIVNFQNQTFISDYQSSQIVNNHWKFQIKTTKLIDQSGQFDFHFDPDQNVIANNSLQWQLPFNYDQPIVDQVQLINDPSDSNRFYWQFSGQNLRNWLWSQWQQLAMPVVSLSWKDFTIISPAGKIIHPFRENLSQNGIRFSIKDPHNYQNPNDQNWDQPTIYSIDPIPIDPAIQVAPGSNWQINFPKVANQVVHFPVSDANIDQSLDPTYHPINKFAIKSYAKFSDHIANATQLDDQDLDQNWIVTNLIANIDQYIYVEGNLDPNWDWNQHLQISNRIFDANNGILSFNLTITNAFDGKSDLVFDQPIVWSGFKISPTTNYDYQFSLVANAITLQLNQSEQDWSAITSYQQWPDALKQLVYRKWEQIFKFSGNLDPLWKVEKNLHIDQLQFQVIDQSQQLYQIQFRLGLSFSQANQSQPLYATITLNNIYLMQPRLQWKIASNYHFQIDQDVVIDQQWLMTNYYQQWFNYEQIANLDQLMKMVEITIANQQAIIKITGVNPITNLSEQTASTQIITWTQNQANSNPMLDQFHLFAKYGNNYVEVDFLNAHFDPSLLFYEKWNSDFPQLNSFNFQTFNQTQFKSVLNSQIDRIFQELINNNQPNYNNGQFYFANQIGAPTDQPPLLDLVNIEYNRTRKEFTIKVKVGNQLILNPKNQPVNTFEWNFTWREFNDFIDEWWKPININDIFKQNEISVNKIKWVPLPEYENSLGLYLRAQVVMQFEQYLTTTHPNDHTLSSFELLRFNDQFVKFDQFNQQAIVKFQYQDVNGWHDHQIIFKDFEMVNNPFPPRPDHLIAQNQRPWPLFGKNIWRLNQGWLEWLFPLFFKNYIDPIEKSYLPIQQLELDFRIILNQSGNHLEGWTITINHFDKYPVPLPQFQIDPIIINSNWITVTPIKQQQLNQIWIDQLNNTIFANHHQSLNPIKSFWIKTLIVDNNLGETIDNYWWLTKLDQQEINGQIKPVFSIASTYINGQPDWDQFQYQLDFALIDKPNLNGFQLNTQSVKIGTSQFDLNQNFDRNWLKDFLWTNAINLTTSDLNPQATYQSWTNWFATNVQSFNWIDVKTLKIILANQQPVQLNFDHSFSQQWQFQTNLNLSASTFINLNSNPTLDDVIKTNWHLFIKPTIANSALNLRDYNQILSARVIKNDSNTVQLQLILKNDQFAIDQGGWIGNKNLVQTFTITKATTQSRGYYQFIDDFPITYQFESPQAITQFNNEQLIKDWLIKNQDQWFVAIDQPDAINRHLKIDQLVINNQSVSFKINLFNDHLAMQQKSLTLSNLFANPYQFTFTTNQLTINDPHQAITLDLLKSWIVTNRWKWLKLSQGKIPFQFDFWNQIVINNYQKVAANNYEVAISLNDANAAHQSIKTTLKLILVEN